MKAGTEKEKVLALLEKVGQGKLSPQEALTQMRTQPFSDLGYALVDHHRALRQGVCEVIYGAGKTPAQMAGILRNMKETGEENVLVTRISSEVAAELKEMGIPVDYHAVAQLGIALPGESREQLGHIVVASAGTSDMAVCEEAALTAENLGNRVSRLYDVGVAGLHRLLARLDVLTSARVVVVVAGMEGALASVVAGLVDCPIIAVPTSVGYGANFGGVSALLSMLNSCAGGVSVVNIDNGFGAGFLANRINRMEGL